MGLNSVTQTILVTTTATVVTILGTFIYNKWKKAKIPSTWEKVGNIHKIHIYPLKSGHRVELERAEVTDVALQQCKEDSKTSLLQLRDRVLVVYSAKDKEMRTARTYTNMVFINVSVHDENHLTIDAPNMKTLYVKIPKRSENEVVNIKWWQGEMVEGVDCGDEAAAWVSRYITEQESGLRLAYNDNNRRRDISKSRQKLFGYYKHLGNSSTGLFTDITSVSLMNVPSVNDLNKRLVSDETIPAEQFRHNIIVDGSDLKPYDEDSWDWVKVGEDVILRNVKDCTRCIMVNINPQNGVRHPKREPLKTLETYRRHAGPDKEPRLGLQLEVKKTGIIKVGDPIYVFRK